MFTTPLPTIESDPELGFVTGTLVHTREGLRPIESIRPGDWVLTHPHGSPPPRRRRRPDETLYRQVARSTRFETRASVRITLKNQADAIENTVVAAADQPIWTQPVGWLAARDVRALQALVLSFNGNAWVMAVQRDEQALEMVTLEVEGCGSYYVEALGTWVGGSRDITLQAAPPANKQPIDFSQPHTLLEIENYYNDTLAEPEPAAPAPTLLEQRMHSHAEQLRHLFKEQIGQDLSYDEAAVQWLDGYIERARHRPTTDQWEGATALIGAFLGECIVRHMGGQWAGSEKAPCVVLKAGGIVFPHHKVAKQFSHGAESDSILGFYVTHQKLQQSLFSTRPLTAAQHRFIEFSRAAHLRVFVPNMEGATPAWIQVAQVDGSFVRLVQPDGQIYSVSVTIGSVRRFYVCSADGALVHAESMAKADWSTLPANIQRQLEHQWAVDRVLTLAQLTPGEAFIEITYGPSDQVFNDGRHGYSTRLRNISQRKLQVLKFGGFTAKNSSWQLASTTGDFYTSEQFAQWYGQDSAWLMPGDTVCDTTNWGRPPVLWAYWIATDDGQTCIAGQVLEKPVASSASGAHFVQPTQPEPDMQQILEKLRDSCKLRQQRMNPMTLSSLLGPVPSWLDKTDGLAEFFKYQKRLLTEGQIVWGALVQANSLLFKPGSDNCPALLVHSATKHFDARPTELQLIASAFGSLKSTEPTDPELNEAAKLVTDEMDRSMGFELPKVFSPHPICSATVMVFRKHIPHGVLTVGLLPILTHPSTRAVMVVPFEFWPIDFIVKWKEGQL